MCIAIHKYTNIFIYVCMYVYTYIFFYIHTVNLYVCKPDVSTFVARTPGIVNVSKQVKVHLARRSDFKKGGVKVDGDHSAIAWKLIEILGSLFGIQSACS